MAAVANRSLATLGLVVQHQLTVVVQGNFRARIMVHADFALLIANFIRDVIAQQFLRFIIHRLATLAVGGIRITILQVALDLIARIATRQRAGYSCDIPAPPAAELMAEDPAGHGA